MVRDAIESLLMLLWVAAAVVMGSNLGLGNGIPDNLIGLTLLLLVASAVFDIATVASEAKGSVLPDGLRIYFTLAIVIVIVIAGLRLLGG